MDDVNNPVFDLAACIGREREAAREFVEVLKREQHALQQADISLLPALAAEKARRAQHLSELSDARNRWLTMRENPESRSGMEHALQDLPAAADAWSDLLRLAETADQLNKINGALIGQRLRYVQQRLEVLQSPMSSAFATALYGSNGQHQPFSGGSRLAEG